MAERALNQQKFHVEGMDCASCAQKIERAVARLPGVDAVTVSTIAETLRVSHDERLPAGAIESQVKRLGYGIALLSGSTASTTPDRPQKSEPAKHDHDHGGHNHDDHAHGDHEDHDHDHDHSDHDHDHSDHDHAGHDHGRRGAKGGGDDEGHGGRGGHSHDHFDLGKGPWWRSEKAVLTWACGAALGVAYLVSLAFPQIGHWAFISALLVGLVPVGWRAIQGVITGSPFTIETLMTIAAVGAVIIGATEEAATVVLLFLVGELLEGVAARRARASISGLTALVPKTALLVDGDGNNRDVPAEDLKPGDVIIVRPGDRISADGEIINGSSAIDEAPVTGESVPRRKGVGDTVFAGTINTDAVLRIKVTAAAADNTIARVVRLVEEAQESKAPTERFIDRFSRIYTPGVLVVGALVAIIPPLAFGQPWGSWVYKGLAVLLIGCPCALVISTPAAIAAGLAAGARRGILIKGGAVLEQLKAITAIAMDKTGTLTSGRPVVTDVALFGRVTDDALALAAGLETGSNHPLALAILQRAKSDNVSPAHATDAKAIPGKGVSGTIDGRTVSLLSAGAAGEAARLSKEQIDKVGTFNAEGKTVSVLVDGDRPLALIAMRDEARPDAKTAIAHLKDDKITPVMLTGDNAKTAEAIGKDLGIEVKAGLLPKDKQDIVRQLQKQGQVVAKVGDGINDAPALAAADVGIAMGGGTDVALETADAAVLHGRVEDIPNMIELSRRTMGNITQNITVALGLKAVFLITTIIGVTGLWPAILADTGATVLVTANAMRLLGWKPKAQ